LGFVVQGRQARRPMLEGPSRGCVSVQRQRGKNVSLKSNLKSRLTSLGAISFNFFVIFQVKCSGKFSGDNVSYVYPDFETVLTGKFVDDVMVEAREAKVIGCSAENGIIRLEISQPRGPIFRYWPSTRTEVICPHLQEDPFERKVIMAAKSSMGGS
jgi:hypothetical protein